MAPVAAETEAPGATQSFCPAVVAVAAGIEDEGTALSRSPGPSTPGGGAGGAGGGGAGANSAGAGGISTARFGGAEGLNSVGGGGGASIFFFGFGGDEVELEAVEDAAEEPAEEDVDEPPPGGAFTSCGGPRSSSCSAINEAAVLARPVLNPP